MSKEVQKNEISSAVGVSTFTMICAFLVFIGMNIANVKISPMVMCPIVCNTVILLRSFTSK